MNCQLCQKQFEAYHHGQLPEGTKAQVDAHLAGCETCAMEFRLLQMTETVIEAEKMQTSNPFLSTRIMAGIEELEQKRLVNQHVSVFGKIFKPVLIGISISAAMFAGVMAGNIGQPLQNESSSPIEFVFFDDEAIESVNMLLNE